MTHDRATPSVSREQSVAEARAEVEARRSQEREEREQAFAESMVGHLPGRWIIAASWMSTGVLGVVTVFATVDPDRFVTPFFAVAITWFFLGSVLFAADVVLAGARSTRSEMGIGGLFFLAGSAPRRVQWLLLGSLTAQVVVALVGAAVRPFTPLAFGTLAPVLALSLCGLWGVRHGLFPDRAAPPGGGRARSA